MVDSKSIACSKCRSKLKLANPPKPGKNVRCPRCGSAFSTGGLDHDEEAHYVTFKIAREHAGVSPREQLRAAGFASFSYVAGAQPKPLEDLKNPQRRPGQPGGCR